MIITNQLTMNFGQQALFENVSAKFKEGHRYGLIGANGSGKSTFMKILSGELEPSTGSVAIEQGQRMGKLGQDQFAFEDCKIIDTVIMGHPELWEIKKERDRIYNLSSMSDKDALKVADLEIRFADLDGYTAEARAGELLLGVGISIDMHEKPMSALAPGLKLRVLLTQVLFYNPDMMLLDEPTNNLDINTIRWLEGVLTQSRSGMIIISHDRHFLNSVCTHIADLDYGDLRIYPGNYDEYMTASTLAQEQLAASNARKQAKIAELQTFVNRFSANASKASQATSRARQIEKIKLEEVRPSSRKSPFIRFTQDKKLFRFVVEIKNLSSGYDQPLFKPVELTLEAGNRLAIIGPNGIGKTTLLRTLIGEHTPFAGETKWVENAQIGYYPQDPVTDFADPNMTLFDWMAQWRKPSDDEQVIRGILGRLLFSGNHLGKKVSALSGGERGRMLFGKLILQCPNVIVMDEPTNHMDMETIEALNFALSEYPGSLIFVSHDRELVSSLATSILDLRANEGGPAKVVHYKGSYEHYLESLGE